MFQRVRLEVPEALGKVKAVAGDVAQPGLGLSDADKRILVDEVSMVFHLAATIRPNETFKYANVETTEPAKKLLIGQPNNYILTNAVIESLLLDERGQLPLAIVRPSIVTASWKDPFPLGLGLLPSVVLRNNCLADLIPVDVAADTLICVAWQIAVTSFADRYDKAINVMNALQLYTTKSWLFRSNNVVGLINDLSPTDKQLFNIDVRKLEWCQYWDQCVLGIRKFLFKTDGSELPDSRKQSRRQIILKASGLPISDRTSSDQIRVNTVNHTVLISTPDMGRADLYHSIQTLNFNGTPHEVATHVADPVDTCRGTVRLPSDYSEAEITSTLRRRNQKLTIGGARRLGSTETILVIFQGKVVPYYVNYDGCALRCRSFRQKVEACTRCREIGHRQDVCTNASDTLCPRCGIKDAPMDHECDPVCVVCQGNHPTGSSLCTQRFKPRPTRSRHKQHPSPTSRSPSRDQTPGSSQRKSRSKSKDRGRRSATQDDAWPALSPSPALNNSSGNPHQQSLRFKKLMGLSASQDIMSTNPNRCPGPIRQFLLKNTSPPITPTSTASI
ncbi:hypothetical protein HPB52_009112 [Rhipicephalus sanguineus]|uniref:Fatty acyl-CoA reductase n=1 Tax=Rhipicephalus sanguineus TaxID=34632 RepID=A0A9D4T3A4_RHISA|nr:hypothetical protein HPB52_009112 [Rhipicephalus sanguineus]